MTDASTANGSADLARSGDDLDRFFRSVQIKAWKMAQLAVRCDDTAADIVQEVMIRFHKRYSSKPANQWQPLFYRCLHNGINDHFRRRQSFRGLIERLVLSRSEPAVAPAADHSCQHGEFSQAVEEALAQLPARQREVFLLRTWQGLSVEETATALQISQGSIKTHLSRANAKLREQLEDFSP